MVLACLVTCLPGSLKTSYPPMCIAHRRVNADTFYIDSIVHSSFCTGSCAQQQEPEGLTWVPPVMQQPLLHTPLDGSPWIHNDSSGALPGPSEIAHSMDWIDAALATVCECVYGLPLVGWYSLLCGWAPHCCHIFSLWLTCGLLVVAVGQQDDDEYWTAGIVF